MKIRVLGCDGGLHPGFTSPAYLVNDSVLFDAGQVVTELTIDQQDQVRDVFVTHFHLDHCKDIAFLSDNALGRDDLPIRVYAPHNTIEFFRKYYFNNINWPDFTTITSGGSPVVKLVGFEVGEELTVQGISVRSFPLEHVIESVVYIIGQDGSKFIYTGDTGPSKMLWRIVNEHIDIKAIIVETSFPNELQNIADVSGHYTPQTLARDLRGLSRDDIIIYIHHLKPNHYDQVQREIEAIGRPNIIILRRGQVLNV